MAVLKLQPMTVTLSSAMSSGYKGSTLSGSLPYVSGVYVYGGVQPGQTSVPSYASQGQSMKDEFAKYLTGEYQQAQGQTRQLYAGRGTTGSGEEAAALGSLGYNYGRGLSENALNVENFMNTMQQQDYVTRAADKMGMNPFEFSTYVASVKDPQAIADLILKNVNNNTINPTTTIKGNTADILKTKLSKLIAARDAFVRGEGGLALSQVLKDAPYPNDVNASIVEIQNQLRNIGVTI